MQGRAVPRPVAADEPPVSRSARTAVRSTVLDRLRTQIARIERRPASLDGVRTRQPRPAAPEPWRTGVEAIDGALPEAGLDHDGLHDIAPETCADMAAAAGFALALLACRQETAGHTILWCRQKLAASEAGALYARGLTPFGVAPGTLLVVTARTAADVLWAMEEGLRTGGLAAVIGELSPPDELFAATRRLSLAAAGGRTPGILLLAGRHAQPTAALSRWAVAAAPSAADPLDPIGPGCPRWRIALRRCRGGRPGAWTVEWCHETCRFHLVPAVSDRSPALRAPQAADDVRPRRRPSVRAGDPGRQGIAHHGG